MPPRDLTADEVSRLIENGTILNEPGADLLTRWLAKAFSANPREAQGFLERQGYKVTPVTRDNKLQFMIHPPEIAGQTVGEMLSGEKQKPKLLDPNGFDFGDIVDIAFDIFVGGPVVGAFVTGGALVGGAGGLLGGPAAVATSPLGAAVGGLAGGAVGGAGFESIRQLVGAAAGVNKNADMDAVIRAAVFDAIAPGVAKRLAGFPAALLRFGKKATGRAANLAKNLAARVAGTSEEEIVSASASAARVRAIASESAPNPSRLMDEIRGTVERLKLPENRFPEAVEIDNLIDKARPVSVDSLLQILERPGFKPVGSQAAALQKSRKIAAQIRNRLGLKPDPRVSTTVPEGVTVEQLSGLLPGETPASRRMSVLRDKFDRPTSPESAGTVSPDTLAGTPSPGRTLVPAKDAQAIKKILQDNTDFSGKPEPQAKVLNRTLKAAQGTLRANIRSALPSSEARARYDKLNGYASYTDADGKFHMGRGLVGKTQSLNEMEARIGEHIKNSTPERFLENATKSGRTQDRRLVEQFDKLHGTDFLERAMTTRLAEKFSRDSPKITTTGQLLGFGTGVAIGERLGGTPGAVVGGVAALEGFSPKGMLRAARGVNKIESMVGRIAKKGGRVVRIGEELMSPVSNEPLVDFIARQGGVTSGILSSREREIMSNIKSQAAQQGTPQLGSVLQQAPTQAAAPSLQQLVNEINAMKGLTGEQRKAELERRLSSAGQ